MSLSRQVNVAPGPREREASKVVYKSLVDPNWFCRHVLNSPNDPWQARFMQAVADVDRARLGLEPLVNGGLLTRFSVASCHGPGKTHVVAKLMHWFGFTHPRALIPATGPKEKSLTTRTWPEFRRILGGAEADYARLVEAAQTKVTWGGDPDWMAVVEAASQPENLAGYHAEHLMFLVEEASGVNEQMFPAIEGALTTEGAILVLIGNPTSNVGEHYNSHNKRGVRERYFRMRIGYQDSPRVSAEWAAYMAKKYGGWDSPVVRIRVMGRWADLDAYQLLAPLWIDGALDRDEEPDGSHPQLRVSVDVADGGENLTVVTVARHYQDTAHVLGQHAYGFPASEAPIRAADAAQRAFQGWGGDPANGDDLVVDALGVGAGTAGTLLDRGFPVVTYRGGEGSDDPSRWKNRRTQSYLVLRDAFRDGSISVAEDAFPETEARDDFEAQLLTIRLKPGQERVEELETKQEMLRRGIVSPDRADSMAMQFATQSPTLGSSGPDMPLLMGQLESEGYNDV